MSRRYYSSNFVSSNHGQKTHYGPNVKAWAVWFSCMWLKLRSNVKSDGEKGARMMQWEKDVCLTSHPKNVSQFLPGKRIIQLQHRERNMRSKLKSSFLSTHIGHKYSGRGVGRRSQLGIRRSNTCLLPVLNSHILTQHTQHEREREKMLPQSKIKNPFSGSLQRTQERKKNDQR